VDPTETAATTATGTRERSPLPEGTFLVGAGVCVAGIGAYLFLAIAARALGPEQYAPLAVLWALVWIVGPGFFLPVEQEVARALADRRSRGIGARPVLRRAATLAAALLGIVLLFTAILSPLLVEHLFAGEWLLVVGFALAMCGACGAHLGRGTCSGIGRFGPYGQLLGGESALRALLCATLAAAGVATAGWYGLAFGLASIIAVLAIMGRQRNVATDGPEARWSELSSAMAALLVGSLMMAALVNAGTVAVQLLATNAESDDAGIFQAGLQIARVPLFLFQAVQAALLPKLSGLAGAGRLDDFRSGLRRLLTLTIAIGAAGTLTAFLIGAPLVELLFGDEFELDQRTLGLLALANAVIMVAMALSQAVIALRGHKRVAVAWSAAVVAFIVGVAVTSDDLFLRVELGLVIGAVVATALLALALSRRLAAGAEPEPGSVITALHEVSVDP
jgi:O-antigen/teichoic acid export membrane protein